MISEEIKFPFYAKATILILGLFAFVTALYVARGIVVPIVFAIIISIVLSPVADFFVRLKINRVVAIVITMLLTFMLIAGLCLLLFLQASQFSESWPVLVDKFTGMINDGITWVSGYFDIKPQKIHEWIAKTKAELIGGGSAALGQTLVALGNWVAILILLPVYVFMILFYRPLILDFIRKLFGKSNQIQVSELVTKTKTVVQRYLVGLIIEFVIVAVLNTIVLLILGIDYAILLGIIGALLNLIPYIGGLVGVALPMMVALATKSSAWYALYVLLAYYIIQLFDNNYIVPKIVASKVKLNALFSVLAVIAGNALWGIPGMFLAIPLLAIIKLICDHIEPLKPWGFLLGDTMPPVFKIKPILKKLKNL